MRLFKTVRQRLPVPFTIGQANVEPIPASRSLSSLVLYIFIAFSSIVLREIEILKRERETELVLQHCAVSVVASVALATRGRFLASMAIAPCAVRRCGSAERVVEWHPLRTNASVSSVDRIWGGRGFRGEENVSHTTQTVMSSTHTRTLT